MAALLIGWSVVLPAPGAAARTVQAVDGALSRPAAGDRAVVALGWVRANRARLGMTAADVDGLELTARATSPGSGFTHVRYRRSDRGIPAFDGGLRVSLDRGGRILSATTEPAVPQVGSATPQLGPAAALRALQRAVGVERAVDVVAGPEGARRTTRFEGGDFARLVLFGSGRGTRLAWHLTYRASDAAHYDAVVDAHSGAILFRQNLTKDAAQADVYESHPAAGAQITVDLQQRGWLAAGAGTLDGPYAHAYSDLDDDNAPSPDEEVERANGHFRFPFTAFPHPTCHAEALCSWDGTDGSWAANRERHAVQAFYLVNRFRDHLAQAPISFNGFAGVDEVRVETTDGAAGGPDDEHLNNASMTTLPEGSPPLMQLYLFRGDGFRTVHGGDSAAVVWHEHTHGLSNRLVVHDDGSGALSSPQAGAMGEGWSDWYALDLLVDEGLLADERPSGEVDMGAYIDFVRHALRIQGLDCPVGVVSSGCPAGGFTYGDFGRIAGGPEVHADGEIWAETLWDLRTAVGSETARALITEAMRMSPPEPSFLDMRNSILAADAGLPGDHRSAIWTVFARRGMGYRAHTDGAADGTPTEDFSLPPAPGAPRGRTAGTVTSLESGLALGNVTVGLASLAGATAFPDRLVTATAPNGSYALDAPAGTYGELAFEAPGYDRVEIPGHPVTAGGTRVRNVGLRRDWAARAGGAAVLSGDNSGAPYGCGLARLIDQRETSGWSAVRVGQPRAVVRLPQAIDVTGFGLDPTNTCGDPSGASTAGYRVETSADGVAYRTALEGAFGTQHRGRLNVLPAAVRNVRYVRLTLRSSLDPASEFVDFSELEVFGAPPNRLPTGALAASRMRLSVGGTVDFGAAFSDPDSRITGYDWDFDGDGAVDRTTAGPATSFTYQRAGTFQAGVAVRDYRGGAGRASRTITVTRLPRPVVKLPRRGRRGRLFIRVTCVERCTVTGRLRVDGRTVRRLRRTIRTTRERRIALTLPRKARRAALRRDDRSVRARLIVTARYRDGRSTTARRTVRVRL